MEKTIILIGSAISAIIILGGWTLAIYLSFRKKDDDNISWIIAIIFLALFCASLFGFIN